MKTFMTFAMLFVCATTVEAQVPDVQQPTAQEQAVQAPAPTPTAAAPAAAGEEPVPVVDMKTRSATTAAVNQATLRAPASADAVAQGVDTPRNFWWLVIAIVVAGAILALVL